MKESFVRTYIETHLRKFGESISAEEAERNLSNLMALVRLIAKKERKNERLPRKNG